MRRLWLLLAAILLVPPAISSFGALGAQEEGVKGDLKDAGRDAKHAAQKTGEATEHAAKRTGRAVKKDTKKVAHKSARKVRRGAGRVEEKTEPNPQQ